MSSVDLDPQEFAPTVRKTTYRGKAVWEVDIRQWPDVAATLGAPKRKRFADREGARAYYRRLIVAEAQGQLVEPVRLPVKRFLDHYLRSVKKKHPETSTASTYASLLKPFRKYIDMVGVLELADVTPAVIHQFVEHEQGRVAATTTQSEAAIVRAAFSWGVRAGIVTENPALGLVPRARAPERRILTDKQRRDLMQDAGPRADYWRLVLLTGIRRSELLGLTIDRVHLDSPVPFLTVIGKGLKRRDLPLVGLVLEAAARLCRDAKRKRTVRLCALTASTIDHHWRTDRDRLGLPGVWLHDLRHDFISVLANGGTPLPVVQRLAGHSKLSTTAHYIHDDPVALREAMQARSDGVQR